MKLLQDFADSFIIFEQAGIEPGRVEAVTGSIRVYAEKPLEGRDHYQLTRIGWVYDESLGCYYLFTETA